MKVHLLLPTLIKDEIRNQISLIKTIRASSMKILLIVKAKIKSFDNLNIIHEM